MAENLPTPLSVNAHSAAALPNTEADAAYLAEGVDTGGWRIAAGSALRQACAPWVELLSSMRFAISLLTIICVSSIIGTVMNQNLPRINYVNQFGAFWADFFIGLGLDRVYSTWWFMLILFFLVVSTTLCVTRNTPKILRGLKDYKEHLREASFKAMKHHTQGAWAQPLDAAQLSATQTLQRSGWRVKTQTRADGSVMLAAKAGSANKLGYIAAHSAIVLVCVGGMLDGDVMVRTYMALTGKSTFGGGGMIADVPAQHRLAASNPSFRGNMLVAEGAKASTGILQQGDAIVLQDLPFEIELKKFVVEHYSTGMPKLFASDIVITDKASGKQTPARVEVNHPAYSHGVHIYQSSFDDGGSSVTLQALPWDGSRASAALQTLTGTVGESKPLSRNAAKNSATEEKLTLEITALRTINVENMGGGPAVDARAVDLKPLLGAANKPHLKDGKELRNVGPSISYKLRDAAGQATEFHNYMLPVELDGARVLLLGVRTNTTDPLRYVRLPVDDQDSAAGFLALKAALLDPAARQAAVQRYVIAALGNQANAEAREQLTVSTQRALEIFAGLGPQKSQKPQNSEGIQAVSAKTEAQPEHKTSSAAPIKLAGLNAIADFIDTTVPADQRERASEVVLRLLNGALLELAQGSRAAAGLKALPPTEATQAFMTQSVMAMADAIAYPAPLTFMLQDFKQVQASVFQLTRSPGKPWVYLGSILLILGVFAMLYVRERRCWVLLKPAKNEARSAIAGQTNYQLAFSVNRASFDTQRQFDGLIKSLQAA